MISAVEQYLERSGYSALNVKAVFFDMDGVLFNSMQYHAMSWIKALGDYDIPFYTEEAYMCEGRTGASTIGEYYLRYKGEAPSREKVEEIYARKVKYFLEVSKVEIIEGVDEVLAYLKAKGIELYVVTGSGQKSLLDTLGTYFPGVFEASHVVSAFDVKKGKPDPEPYLMAMQRAGVTADEAMVVENAPLGVKSSSSAGLFSVAVNTGTLSDEKLYEYGADIVLGNMGQLLNKIKMIL